MSGKAKNDQLLVTSREYDSRYYELSQALDKCAEAHVDCIRCPLMVDCQNVWDVIMNTRTHYKLRPKDVQLFEAKFKEFHKQLVLLV